MQKTTKEELRKNLLSKMKSVAVEERLEWDEAVRKNIGNLESWVQSKHPCVYMSLPEEVDTKTLMDNWAREKTYSVLKWAGDSFIPVHFTGWENVAKNKWGVFEPATIQKTPLPEIDCVLVPGVAFSKTGKRLGRGMGFYDRFLKKIHAPKIGLAFEMQLTEDIPTDEWDQEVDFVVTEKGIYRR